MSVLAARALGEVGSGPMAAARVSPSRSLPARILGFGPRQDVVDDTADMPVSLGQLPALTLVAAIGVFLAALSANASRAGGDWAVPAFYASIALVFFPSAARAVWPLVSRAERIGIVLMLATALFLVKLVRSPVAFIDHDEFLHWRTALDIVERGRLFSPNGLLPVSPLYPGLELATTALALLTGLSLFWAGTLVLFTARILFMAALFLFFERVAASARVSTIACLVFTGSSTFMFFDVHFSYESLAVTFLVVALVSETLPGQSGLARARLLVFVTLPILVALALTHHVTAFFAAGLFGGHAVLETIRHRRPWAVARWWIVAAVAVLLPFGWSKLMGDPGTSYLGPVFESGVQEVVGLLNRSTSRKLFVSDDGTIAPAWQRVITLASVLILCLGLVAGFFRSLARGGLVPRLTRISTWLRWDNSWLVLLTALTVAFPISLVFRLTRSGWEIGNRLGPFSFYGVALVVAVAVACVWRRPRLAPSLAVGGLVTVLLLGGIISAEGPRVLVPANYKVSADAASIGPLGISAALWTRNWLGRDNLFAADRVDRLLLATYGRQEVTTTLQDGRDASRAITATTLGPREIGTLRDIGVRYVMTDLRLTTALPAVGVYFDGGDDDRGYVEPLRPEALLKFGRTPKVSRLFDNGYLMIYDVGGLYAAR